MAEQDLFFDEDVKDDDLRSDSPRINDDAGKQDDDDNGGNDGGNQDDNGLDPEALKKLAEDDDEDDADAKGGKSPVVPHARFNEVNEQLKQERQAREEAERRLAELQQGGKKDEPDNKDPEFDLKSERKAYTEALMEGDTDKALEIQERIDAHMLAQAEAKAEARLQERQRNEEQKSLEALFNDAADKAEATYPSLKPGDASYNEEAVEMVNALVAQNLAKGQKGHEALTNAVERVAKVYGWSDNAGSGLDKDKADKGNQDAVRRGVDTANRQPANPTGSAGNREREPGKINPANVDKDDWEDLPQAERDRLLGRM